MPDVGAAGGADHPHRDRLVEAERIADRDGPLADPEGVGVAQGGHRDLVVGLELDHREVRFRVGPHDLSAVFSFVGETDQDLVRALDDVEVGEHQAALVDDDAGPETGPAELGARVGTLGAEELIEEVAEERVVVALGQVGAAPGLRALDGAEVDNRGPHLLGHVHEAHLERFGQRDAGRRLRGGRGGRGARSSQVTAHEVAAARRGDQQRGDHTDQYQAAAHVCTLAGGPRAGDRRTSARAIARANG